ncbi:MAG: carbohydrate ABC transporter permease [Caldilineaceae bacterium]
MAQETLARASSAAPLRPPTNLGRIALYVTVLALCAMFGYPFFWTLMSSLKTIPEMFAFPPVQIPASPQWSNYWHVLNISYPVGRWFINSLIIVVLAVSGTVITASLVAYSFARFEYRGRNMLFMITLATMMLPAQVTLIPQFVLFYKLGWINTILPLWVPSWFGGGAFAIFLMRQFFMTIPRELEDAALMDGCNRFRIYRSIVLPLAKPVLATVTIFAFMGAWNEFFRPLIYLGNQDQYTLSLGLRVFVDAHRAEWGMMMAASTMMVLPVIVIFFLAQKHFVQGITLTGLKG